MNPTPLVFMKLVSLSLVWGRLSPSVRGSWCVLLWLRISVRILGRFSRIRRIPR